MRGGGSRWGATLGGRHFDPMEDDPGAGPAAGVRNQVPCPGAALLHLRMETNTTSRPLLHLTSTNQQVVYHHNFMEKVIKP